MVLAPLRCRSALCETQWRTSGRPRARGGESGRVDVRVDVRIVVSVSAVDKAAAFILTPIPPFVTALRLLSKKEAIFTHCACLRKGLQVLRQHLRKEKTCSVEHLEAPLRRRVEAEMVYSDYPRLCDGRANHDET